MIHLHPLRIHHSITSVFLISFYFLSFAVFSRSSFLEESHKQEVPPSFLKSSNGAMARLYPELSSGLAEGDVLEFPRLVDENGRNAIAIEEYKWPDGIVPYEFHPKFDNLEEQEKVRRAMDSIQNKTCVKFIPHKSEESYIMISKDKPGCFAKVGYRKKEVLPVNYQSPECLQYLGLIVHELLHVLGLFHEQSRSDRDDYVKIFWENVDPKYKNDFQKTRSSETTAFGVAYDMYSVMHYPNIAFSRNGKDTMQAYERKEGEGSNGSSGGWLSYLPLTLKAEERRTDPKIKMGQREGATDSDLEKVRRMYKCGSPVNYE